MRKLRFIRNDLLEILKISPNFPVFSTEVALLPL